MLAEATEVLGAAITKPFAQGEVHGKPTFKQPLPAKGEVKRYILTSAQSNTYVHEQFFDNLLVYAEYLDAEVMVSRFTYNRTAYGKKAVKPGSHPTADDYRELWFDPAIEPFVCDERVELAPALIFCGETNISPTATRPLSGFETYTGAASAIFPHPKIALESLAQLDDTHTKFTYTTGTVTLRNYIQKKAGLRAEHHHCFAALLVEVDDQGDWWVRQLNATDDGSFYDLLTYVSEGSVSSVDHIEAVNWGDIHVDVLDPVVRDLSWGDGGILDALRPRFQFMNDTLDFRVRNHHEIKNCHSRFRSFVIDQDSVRDECKRAVDFLQEESYRDFCETVVVDSNHDNALTRWLREADYRDDPVNAVFFLECQLRLYNALERDPDLNSYHVLEDTFKQLGLTAPIYFLKKNESFLIAGNIECGMHGDLGPNGARGTPLGLSKLGRKANTGHTHSAQIVDGMYVAGTAGKLRVSFNDGPSSWSHSLVLTYPNGKRCIVTIWSGKWRA